MKNDRDVSFHSQENRLGREPDAGVGRLWVGCSDSPVNPRGLESNPRGMIHTNLGNFALPSDMSFLASLKMAIDSFDALEIIVCGHYGCRAVEIAASGSRIEILGDWLAPLRSLHRDYARLHTVAGEPRSKADALVESNVLEQMKNASRTSIVRDASASRRKLTIRGIVLDPATGRSSYVGNPIFEALKFSDGS